MTKYLDDNHAVGIQFSSDRKEIALIRKIASRAHALYEELLPARDVPNLISIMMDIEATHCNGCKLRLDELLAAHNRDFAHDIGGIRHHLNRETGQLQNCFLPRYAAIPERQP